MSLRPPMRCGPAKIYWWVRCDGMTGFRSANVRRPFLRSDGMNPMAAKPNSKHARSSPPSYLEQMAALMAEGLARHAIHEPWDQMNEGDRQSVLAVCDWLLMDWP